MKRLKHFLTFLLILLALSLSACSKEKPGTPLNLPPAEEPSARLFNDFGIDFFEKGNYFDASLNFNQAIVADHTSGEVHYNMALALYMRGEEERAVKELQLAKQYADGNPEILDSPFLKRYVK
ncbi:MAG: hypothetical protein G3M78_01570 [Candidatus Nitrohelix vancouverensis]|uniref:Tetratricopeptide repeat protein n=1 Tax=Candidatus Nitrohelix vancouverensis TaxID=2705534 RepID=A0A7T0G2B6_9BACT|nr:MAG: hypothetical protein G3M78_01570 [Candidatus Nitrohelix vancouverensis]